VNSRWFPRVFFCVLLAFLPELFRTGPCTWKGNVWVCLEQIGCLPYFDTWYGLSANLEYLSEMCCTRLAGNTGRKKSPSVHHRTLLCCIFATKARINNRKKNLLNSNTSSTCPYNMANFSPLAAEICWRVWGTPVNFNGFCVLAALLHSTLVVGISQTLRHFTKGTTYIPQGGCHVGHWPTF